MKKILLLSLALAGLFPVPLLRASPFAAAVVSYNPGSGYAGDYTNTAAVLGQPATNEVDPFAPPFDTNEILSIGTGGWLTVEFDHPLVHYPNTSRDFIIFGNSFFVVTNYGATNESTDGDIYTSDAQTLVSVSRDGVNFYSLNPSLAPTVSEFYPTDGAGNFQLPMNPGVTNFAGLTLPQIRLLYNGSAGGASYNTAWAQDASGNPVSLPDIRYVRVDVLTNRVEIGGFAAVEGTVITENFANNPAVDGWLATGATNLFSWNAAARQLNVTWDSTQPNSYYYHPLGTILTSNDEFDLSFDLTLTDAVAPTNAYQFELAIGLLDFGQAANSNFLRGTGDNSTNLAEFDYFPADNVGDSASIDATLIDGTGQGYNFCYDDEPLNPGTTYHVTLHHTPGGTVTGEVFTNGVIYTALTNTYGDGLANFQLDTLAVDNYSGLGSGGSAILAHGAVQNIFLNAPPPPIALLSGQFVNGVWEAQFWSRTNWNYTLQKSVDLKTWNALGASVPGPGGLMQLTDPAAPIQAQYYRVVAVPQP